MPGKKILVIDDERDIHRVVLTKPATPEEILSAVEKLLA